MHGDAVGPLVSGAPPSAPSAQVTLSNWEDGPHNRWAFQHIRELIPTARISRGSGPARELPTAPRDVLGIEFESGGRPLRVADMLAETYTDGFAVLHRGQLIAEHYDNNMAPDTLLGVEVGDGRSRRRACR